MNAEFQTIADYYDAMYVNPQEYEKEINQVIRLIDQYSQSDNPNILDIACGTGEQSLYLSRHYRVTGIDLSEEMLQKAREKVTDAEFLKADMLDFKLKRRYKAAVNLYGSIGFAENFQQLMSGLCCVWDCLVDGGVLILTPWSTRETFAEGMISDSGEGAGIQFCRMEMLRRISEGKAEVEMFHLIGKNMEVHSFRHTQMISLFSEAEYIEAIESAGFTIKARLSEQEFRMGAFVCVK